MKIPSEVCLMTKRLLAGAQRLESLWNKPSVLGRFNKYHKSYHHQWALVNLSNLEGIFDDMTMLTPLLYKVLTQSFFRKVAVHWKLNISTTTQSSRCQEEFSHGTQQSFMWEGSTRRCNPSLVNSILYTIFDRKGIPFVYLPLTSGTPFTDLV